MNVSSTEYYFRFDFVHKLFSSLLFGLAENTPRQRFETRTSSGLYGINGICLLVVRGLRFEENR